MYFILTGLQLIQHTHALIISDLKSSRALHFVLEHQQAVVIFLNLSLAVWSLAAAGRSVDFRLLVLQIPFEIMLTLLEVEQTQSGM